MEDLIKHKMYLGIFGLMLPIPPFLSAKGSKKGETGARANAKSLSEAERRLHHFVVMKLAVANEPITAEFVAKGLGMPIAQVLEIFDKLEKLKTFIYREDGKGINWAYPLSLKNTGHRITASSGEQFFAA